MEMHKYRKRLFEKVLDSNIKIILPEITDARIVSAADKMKKIGFNIIALNDFSDNYAFYKESLSNKNFTKNWTEKMIDEYLQNSLIQGLLMLDNNIADSLVAGGANSTADVIKSSIRIVWAMAGTVKVAVSKTIRQTIRFFFKVVTNNYFSN